MTTNRLRGFVELVGVGPGEASHLTLGAVEAIERADEIWCQDLGEWNRERPFLQKFLAGRKVVNVASLYSVPGLNRGHFYRLIAERLVHLANRGRRITYLWSGNPLIWVDTPEHLQQHAAAGRVDLRIVPGMSFLDVIWLNAPIHGREFQLRTGRITQPDVSPRIDVVLGQVLEPEALHAALGRLYPPRHQLFLTGVDPVFSTRLSRQTSVQELPNVLPAFENLFYVLIIPRIS